MILTRWRLTDPTHVLFELADDPEARDWLEGFLDRLQGRMAG